MHFDWAAVWHALSANLKTLGFGGGALALQLLRFMPAPYEDQSFRGWIMDAVWTVVGQSRAGERRKRSARRKNSS